VGEAKTNGTLVENRAKVNLREVDSTNSRTVVEVTNEGSTDLSTDHGLGLLRRSTDVRGEDEVRAGAKLRGPSVEGVAEVGSVRSGFGGEDIDGGTGEFATLEAVNEGRDVDDLAAGVVEEVSSVLHLGDLLGANEVGGFGKFGNVKGEEVGGGEELVEGVDLLGGSEGHDGEDVVVEDVNAHRLGEDGKLGTDVTVTDDLFSPPFFVSSHRR
jgi:hypothetical protein